MYRVLCVLCLLLCLCPIVCATDLVAEDFQAKEMKSCASVTGPFGNTVSVNGGSCGKQPANQNPNQGAVQTIAPPFVPETELPFNGLSIAVCVGAAVAGAGIGVVRQWKNTESAVTL